MLLSTGSLPASINKPSVSKKNAGRPVRPEAQSQTRVLVKSATSSESVSKYQQAHITMSGWLDKRGGQEATKGWKKRWCILSDNTLRYYRSDSDGAPAGTIFAEDIEDVREDYEESQKDSSKYGFVFKILTKGRDYVFNAVSNAKREEWVKKIKSLLEACRAEDSLLPEIRYATVEVFLNRGLRISGDVGSVLTAQLSPGGAKSHADDKGWFVEYPLQHTAILNLFTMHGWSLATAFQSNGFPPGSSTGAPSDTLIFTHPN